MFSFLISDAAAQTAPVAGNQPSLMTTFFPFVIIFVIFYFLMIRPQKKRMKEEQDFLSKLQKGDEIFTKSGIIGRVHGLTDRLVTLEISDEPSVKIKVIRSEIAGLAKRILEEKTPEKK